MASNFLLQDTFTISDIDPDGKAFQRVSRFVAKSERLDIETVCDYNSDLFKPKQDQKLEIVLTLTIDDHGNIESNPQYNPRLKSKLLDEYEYVMFGKVFKVKQPTEETKQKTEVYVSYGGLLMSLIGHSSALQAIELDSPIYLLIRKAK
jgi:DNA-directed RNA polymerase I, II, and III subunit RPABC3